MSQLKCIIRGVGSYLPEETLTNSDLARIVDTSDEWIVERTGIRERHRAAPGEFTSDLATKAALAALKDAGLQPDDIDLIVLATATPDNTFPASAVQVQANLGIRHGFAFDLHAVCSGFVYALTTADAQLKAGLAKRALVIGAETFTRILDWTDRGTCVLFGDGAGAVVLEAVDADSHGERGIITSHLRREVFKHAVGMITDVIEASFAATGTTAADIDWFVPHQANRRIIDASVKKLGIAPEKVVITVDVHGNTSAASIPLALSVAKADGRIQPNDLILLEAMGGGFTWGAVMLRW